VIEAHRSFVVSFVVSVLELRLDVFQLVQLLAGDVTRRSRRQLSPDVRLDAGHVRDVAARHRQHHEAAMRSLNEQSLGPQLEQRLANRRHADPQFGGQLLEADILAGAEGALEDSTTHVARDVLRELRPRNEIRNGHIRYSASSRLLMICFWISLVPSPMSRNGASRISRSISYSLE